MDFVFLFALKMAVFIMYQYYTCTYTTFPSVWNNTSFRRDLSTKTDPNVCENNRTPIKAKNQFKTFRRTWF